VTDIFRRATELGGHLVVAFVAPVSASSRSSRPRPGVQFSSPESQAASAQAMVGQLIGEVVRKRTGTPSEPQPATSPPSEATPKPGSAASTASGHKP
jgi:hypothetical protein